MDFRPEAEQMRDYLKRQNIAALYHFTNIENLPLILQVGGLCSKEWLEHNGLLDRINTGGNMLSKAPDQRHGNWDKVSLSFCQNHPMAYYREAEQHMCYAVIKLDVALRRGVQFTDRNATDNNEQRGEGLQGLSLVDFSAVRANFPYGSNERRKKKQAEALTPDFVPLSDFHGFGFRSESNLKEAERLCGTLKHPIFKVKEGFFRRDCPHVKKHVLTADVVTRENVRAVTFSDQIRFKAEQRLQLTLIANTFALTGTDGTIRWSDSSDVILHEASGTFTQTSEFVWWSSLAAGNLRPGNYYVTCYLGNVRQLTLLFQIAD